ncbi:MAG TPA: hypothetical protein VKU02_21500 [Gemmataceae bacterium]|nr:hypothetical protein [Gemmataceae bacterium]
MNEFAQDISLLAPSEFGERDRRAGLQLGKRAVKRHHATPHIFVHKLAAGQLLDVAEQLPLSRLGTVVVFFHMAHLNSCVVGEVALTLSEGPSRARPACALQWCEFES